jgi:acetolactate synthase-1/2/3 large subunit
LVSDVGVHHNWLLQFCRPKNPHSLIGSMGFGAMGFGVAGVLGAAVAAPSRPCVSVCGDGAFLMHASVMATAVEYKIPAIWVVWNNYAFASIRGLQRGYLEGRELVTDFKEPDSNEPYNPDLRRWPAAGINGVRVETAKDLGEALVAAIKANKPASSTQTFRRRNPGGAERGAADWATENGHRQRPIIEASLLGQQRRVCLV